MLRPRWGRRSYANATGGGEGSGGGGGPGPGPGGGGGLDPGGGGPGPGGGGPGAGVRDERQQWRERAALQGKELADKKKFFFQEKLFLEGKRKKMGKGNIVTFLLSDARQGIEPDEINKMLRVGGFKPSETVTIKINDFRANQVEVLFEPGVILDACVVEEKLRKGGMDVSVSKFDHVEEFLMIYGLPPTFDIEVVRLKINEAISPFVNKILEVAPCIHKGVSKDDFFDGKFDGNWRLKVVPKSKVQIPNFIVIGNEAQVMGKAVYTKKLGDKEEMCADCFRTGHYRKDCPGPRKWIEYCEEFKGVWEGLSLGVDEEEEESEAPSGDENSRLFVMNKALARDLAMAGHERDRYAAELQARIDLDGKVEDLTEKVNELEMAKREADSKVSELVKVIDQQKQGEADASSEPEGLQRILEEKDQYIKELEEQTNSIRKEVGGLQKLNEVMKNAMDENVQLKERVEKVLKEKRFLEEKQKEREDEIISAHRRLSKSFNSEVVDIPTPAMEEMFTETESPPFTGFQGYSSPKGDDVLGGNPLPATPPKMKRFNSSPGGLVSNPKKKGSRHPSIGSEIVVDTADGREVYTVHYKVNPPENDFLYCLLKKDGKMHTLNLKRVIWDSAVSSERGVTKDDSVLTHSTL